MTDKDKSQKKEMEQQDEEDSPYDSMIRSLTNRGKNKRKVKLVENQLMQFAFGESDSEEDEDFKVNDHDVDSDDSNLEKQSSASEPGSEQEEQASDSDNEESQDSDEEESQESQDSDAESSQGGKVKSMKIGDLLSAMRNQDKNQDSAENEATNEAGKKPLLVCGICLESEDSEKDEILECDNCGITVHEGCYGDIVDQENDDDKSDSDGPTEPWFCESCKEGLDTSPMCELCPNIGGIYKQTDTGKWVHLVCALYTPYVGFRDISKLQTVVLEDLKPSMWSGSECMFCVDDNFSRTGVCINCDAGMCRTTFHVTCGQKNGFLSDIPDRQDLNESKDEAPDLLYAHCKLHSEKVEMKKRKNSWLAFQSHVSKFKQSEDELERERIQAAFVSAKKEYLEFRRQLLPSKPTSLEYPRLLSSCPEVCMLLAKKAEILGLLRHPGYNVAAAIVSGRVLKHEANLSAEFVNYFFKREMQVKDTEQNLKTAEPTLLKLQKEQKSLTEMSGVYQEKLDSVLKEKERLWKSCKALHHCVCKLAGKAFRLPDVLKPKVANESKAKIEQSTKLLNEIINRCATCKSTEDQHLLALCENCKNYYHLACVDPPLTRMPKKSDKYIWQCTECDSSDESENEIEIEDENETDGIRRTKRTTKEPEKFTPEAKRSEEFFADSGKRKTSRVKEESPLPKKKKVNETNKKKKKEEVKKSAKKPEKKRASKKRVVAKKPAESFEDCCICHKSGDKTSLVKCDECKKCYHFKTCLDPPYAKTPKGKYYGWICEDCDESEEEGENEAEE